MIQVGELKLAESVHELEWFNRAVEISKANLRATPEASRPKWIRDNPALLD